MMRIFPGGQTYISDSNNTTIGNSELLHQVVVVGYHKDNTVGITGGGGVGNSTGGGLVLKYCSDKQFCRRYC